MQVRSSMVSSFHNPEFFGLWLGIVQLVYHPSWYEIVFVTVDEEHGLVAMSPPIRFVKCAAFPLSVFVATLL